MDPSILVTSTFSCNTLHLLSDHVQQDSKDMYLVEQVEEVDHVEEVEEMVEELQ